MASIAKRLIREVSDQNLDGDLISHLPDNVVDNILMFLPQRDAVRTSVLSKKWRHKWETLPQLVIDSDFEDSLKQSPAKKELLSTIYQIMLLHSGPILKFTLNISGSESFHEIGPMIRLLSRNGIQDLTLCINRIEEDYNKDEEYKTPLCLFSCLELRILWLSFCLFKPPATFTGFNRLTNVYFENVYLGTDVQDFIFKCPLLEKLTMEYCLNIDHLDIYAPNLKVLHISVHFKSIYFRNTPLLTTASVKGDEVDNPEVENGIDMLEILAAGDIPEMLPTPFNHLRTLVLSKISLDCVGEVSCALCLIKCSPHLQKLEIEVAQPSDDFDAAEKFLAIQNKSMISLDKLQEVKMLPLTGSWREMWFVELVLAKSPSLERMHLHPSKNISTNEELKLLTEITQFCRASAVAKIIYSGAKQVNF